jgi:phenylacetate-CoA ligase
MQPDSLDPDKKQAVLDLLASHQVDARLEKSVLEQKLGQQFKTLLQVAQLAPWWSPIINEKAAQIREANSISDLLALFPVLTRAQIQQQPSLLWTTPNLDKDKKFWKLTTSGSTGKPVTVYRQINAHHIQQGAGELLDVVWQNRDLSKPTAFMKITPDNDDQKGLGTPFNYLGPTGLAYRRSLANNTIAYLLDFIAEKNIKNLLIGPSALKFMLKEQIRSPRANVKLESVMSWADPLDPELRISVREVFGAKISDRYSSTEFGFLAIQCPGSEHLHAMQFNNYIEILNDNNQPCGIGEPGRVVVTSLQNLAMPIIRYELGDVAAFGPPCEHGINLPVFEPRIVRTREFLLLADGSLEIPYFDIMDLAKHPDTNDYQGYRFNDGMVVLFSARSKLDQSVLDSSVSKLKNLFKSADQILLVQVDSLEWLGMWKRKLVITVDENMPEELTQEYFEKLNADSVAASQSV